MARESDVLEKHAKGRGEKTSVAGEAAEDQVWLCGWRAGVDVGVGVGVGVLRVVGRSVPVRL